MAKYGENMVFAFSAGALMWLLARRSESKALQEERSATLEGTATRMLDTARAMRSVGNYTSAIEMVDRAMSLTADRSPFLWEKAITLYESGDVVSAMSIVESNEVALRAVVGDQDYDAFVHEMSNRSTSPQEEV